MVRDLQLLDGHGIDDFREGEISMRFKPLEGRIDQGAGILFNLKPNGDYLTVRANALENNLVLWQVGTNVVLRDHPLGFQASLLHEGFSWLKATGSDVILIDPQFAPKVLVKSEINEMIDLIATTHNLLKLYRAGTAAA